MTVISRGICGAILFCAIIPSRGQCTSAGSENLKFYPLPGSEVILLVRDQKVEVSVAALEGKSVETIDIETEKKLSVKIDDYNFDGIKDFSVSHIDDGMGTYEISQIYLYSKKSAKFVPLVPKCGDEFINLRVLKKERILINSYVDENRYKTCKMKF